MVLSVLSKHVIRFAGCQSGNFAMAFALIAPMLLGLTGGVVDYAVYQQQKSDMQDVADTAAIAAAKEAAVKSWSASAVQSLAVAIVDTHLNDNSESGGSGSANFTVYTSLDDVGKRITVQIDMDQYHYFLLGYFRKSPQIRVTSTASVAGDSPICVVGLETQTDDIITLKDQSGIVADKCAVYGNSGATKALFVDTNAKLRSGFTCTSGGFSGSTASYEPRPTTDCPPLGDPLSERPAPSVGVCDHQNFAVKGGAHTIYPGVYCGGILIDNDANVVMRPGIYVINGGEFRIRNDGSLVGEGVGIYFTGSNGRAVFDGTSSISLAAPEDGDMAGLLMFQDRAMDLTEYEISSKSAAVLLGTVYLPNGRLKVHANNAVAESSAFTVIVARYIDIAKKAKLYINSGYSTTNVPVPAGLGPNSNARLTN